MNKPDEILGESDCRFVLKLDGIEGDKLIKHMNIRPITAPINFNILEVMSGNGEAAEHIISTLLQMGITISSYKSTDVITSPVRRNLELGNDENGNPIFSFDQCDTIDAITRHGTVSNTLLMISPSPTKPPESEESLVGIRDKAIGLADYYACNEYIKQTSSLEGVNREKYIIIVGELGASDGTIGIYKYLMEHPNLKLIYKNRILFGPAVVWGAAIKEVYILKTKFD